MKAASGELNLTVITLIAIALIATFFMATMWPQISSSIQDQWDDINGSGGNAIERAGNPEQEH